MKVRSVLLITVIVAMIISLGCGRDKSEDQRENSENGNENNRIEASALGESAEDVGRLASVKVDEITVFFSSEDDRYLIPMTININSTEQGANIAIQEILAGPGDEYTRPSIPTGTKIRDIYVEDGIVKLNLTNHFLNLNTAEESERAVKALLLTLKPFIGEKKVQILIDGEVVEYLEGNVHIGSPLKPPAYVNYVGEDYKEARTITVYYANEPNAMYLIPITFDVFQEDKVQAVADALVKGPGQDSGLTSTLWPGTQILDVNVNDEGVLEIDLSEQAIGYGGGSSIENIFLNSLLLSFTHLEEVSYVQIYIEGEKVDTLPEGTPIDRPLAPKANYNVMSK